MTSVSCAMLNPPRLSSLSPGHLPESCRLVHLSLSRGPIPLLLDACAFWPENTLQPLMYTFVQISCKNGVPRTEILLQIWRCGFHAVYQQQKTPDRMGHGFFT